MQNVNKEMRSHETSHRMHPAHRPAFSYDVGKISAGCLVTVAGGVCRQLRKKKRKEQQQQKLEAGVDVGPSRKALKRNTMKNSRCEITVAVDLSFDDLMSDKVVIVVFVTFFYSVGYSDATQPAKISIHRMRISYAKSVGCRLVAGSKFISTSYYSYWIQLSNFCLRL